MIVVALAVCGFALLLLVGLTYMVWDMRRKTKYPTITTGTIYTDGPDDFSGGGGVCR